MSLETWPISRAPLSQGIFIGTSPPPSPYDGQEWIYPVDPTNGISWKFRYHVGQTLPWEFVGGAAVYTGITTEETPADTTVFRDLPTPGPLITVPRTGNYQVSWGCYFHNAGAAMLVGNVGVSRQGDAAGTLCQAPAGFPASAPTLRFDTQAGAFVTSQVTAILGRTAGGVQLAALDVLVLRYYASVAGGSGMAFGNRWMMITPVKVS